MQSIVFFFAVQFCGKDSWTTGYDRQTIRTGNRMQNYGQREGFHERQKEGVYNNVDVFTKQLLQCRICLQSTSY